MLSKNASNKEEKSEHLNTFKPLNKKRNDT